MDGPIRRRMNYMEIYPEILGREAGSWGPCQKVCDLGTWGMFVIIIISRRCGAREFFSVLQRGVGVATHRRRSWIMAVSFSWGGCKDPDSDSEWEREFEALSLALICRKYFPRLFFWGVLFLLISLHFFYLFFSFWLTATLGVGGSALLFPLGRPWAVFNSVYRLLAAHRLMQIRLRNLG